MHRARARQRVLRRGHLRHLAAGTARIRAAGPGPRQRSPATPGTAAGPRSRSNSARSGAAPSRRRAWVSAAVLGWATARPSRPATRLAAGCWKSCWQSARRPPQPAGGLRGRPPGGVRVLPGQTFDTVLGPVRLTRAWVPLPPVRPRPEVHRLRRPRTRQTTRLLRDQRPPGCATSTSAPWACSSAPVPWKPDARRSSGSG